MPGTILITSFLSSTITDKNHQKTDNRHNSRGLYAPQPTPVGIGSSSILLLIFHFNALCSLFLDENIPKSNRVNKKLSTSIWAKANKIINIQL